MHGFAGTMLLEADAVVHYDCAGHVSAALTVEGPEPSKSNRPSVTEPILIQPFLTRHHIQQITGSTEGEERGRG